MVHRFEVERRASRARWIILLVFTLVMLVIGIVPVIKARSIDEEQILQFLLENYKDDLNTLNKRTIEFWARDPLDPRIFTEYYSYNYLMRVQVENRVKAPIIPKDILAKANAGELLEKYEKQLIIKPWYNMLIRWEIFTLYMGIYLIISVVIGTLSPYILRQTVFRADDEAQLSKGNANLEKTLDPENIQALEYEKLLAADVTNTYRKSSELMVRSNLFLFSGIVLAVVGVIIFFITLPESNSKQLTTIEYLRGSIRPMSVLIFVETVAWFLLRQFRAGIDDFKYFHLLYIQRVNILLALKLEKNATALPDLSKLVQSLVAEPIKIQNDTKPETTGKDVEGALTILKDMLAILLKDKTAK